ncbi:MAG: response regulator [Anaerolineae bacterium]|nr:response regulator [Anaerolineae bacterium]
MARILIVDDSATIRRTIGLILDKHHKTFTAVNGQDALDQLAHNVVDLIVSDLQMPVMNGLEFLYHLRADQRYYHLPVIMLTQSSYAEDQTLTEKSGANCFLSKPASSWELLETVDRLLQYNSQATKPLPPLPPIDRNLLQSLLGCDAAEIDALLAEALPVFIKEASQIVVNLINAIHERGWQTVIDCCGTLRGSSSSLGATRLAELCFEMETAVFQGNTRGMSLRLIKIQAEVARIRIYADAHFPEEPL